MKEVNLNDACQKLNDMYEEELKRYLKVLERFPEINPEEVKLKCSTISSFAGFLIFNPIKYGLMGYFAIEPAVHLGYDFFKLAKDEKEGIIAHETGHYFHFKKNFNSNRVKRLIGWHLEYKKNKGLRRVINSLSKEGRHRIKSLQKWHIMNEIYADNRAVRAGYGSQLLTSLKNFKNNYSWILPKRNKKEIKARIENLEKILEI